VTVSGKVGVSTGLLVQQKGREVKIALQTKLPELTAKIVVDGKIYDKFDVVIWRFERKLIEGHIMNLGEPTIYTLPDPHNRL
jgi:hypothetical protein